MTRKQPSEDPQGENVRGPASRQPGVRPVGIVPVFPSPSRLGGVLLLLLAMTALAGIPLALRYDPDPTSAHASVSALAQGVWGWVRGVHAWGATFVVLLLLLHPLSAWLRMRDLRVPKHVWLSGVVLLGVLLVTYLTGTVLRFDHRGWEALEHIEHGANVIGVSLIREGDPASAPLDWMFLLHVLAVPLTVVALVGVHLARSRQIRHLVKRLGRFARDGARPAAALAGAVFLLALVAPARLGPAPVAGLEVTNPPWPFLWLVPLQDWAGAWGLWMLPLLIAVVAAAPWLTRRLSRRARGVAAGLGAAVLLFLTLLGGGAL